MTRVVHCQREYYDVYIGRVNKRHGLSQSKWANPYVAGKPGTRAEVITLYRTWVLTQPELLAALPELTGKILGCWCAPHACHGDVLVALTQPAYEADTCRELGCRATLSDPADGDLVCTDGHRQWFF